MHQWTLPHQCHIIWPLFKPFWPLYILLVWCTPDYGAVHHLPDFLKHPFYILGQVHHLLESIKQLLCILGLVHHWTRSGMPNEGLWECYTSAKQNFRAHKPRTTDVIGHGITTRRARRWKPSRCRQTHRAYRAVAGVLHVLVWFVLVLQMQHLQGIHTYREEASHTELLGLWWRLSEGERGMAASLQMLN